MNTTLRGGRDRWRGPAAAAALALILGLAACGGDGGGGNGPGSKQLDLVIGNSLPLSGGSESLGQSGQKASQLALDQIKRAAAARGSQHDVRIVNRDQGPDAGSAAESARRLVDEDHASCLTGPWSSAAVARSAHDVAIPAKVLMISPVATGDDVADLSDHDLVDSTALPVSVEGDALAMAIELSLGGIEGHTVNVAAGTDPSHDTIAQDFIKKWQDDDGRVGGKLMLAPPPSGDAAQASQLTSDSPSAVLLVDNPAGFAQLAPALSSGPDWDPGIAWGSDQLVSPAIPAQAGAQEVDGMRALAPGMPSGAQPTSAFVDEFNSAQPRQVGIEPFAAQQFDATILCYLAAVAAGSTEGQKMADELIDITAPGGTEYTWRQLPDAIKALENGDDINYTGASGPLDMDVHGNPTNGVYGVYRYAGGRLEAVGEVPVSKPNPATP